MWLVVQGRVGLPGAVRRNPGRRVRPLADLRILVVEDEAFIAWEIEEQLRRLGCEVVGPVGRLERALELVRSMARFST